MTVLDASNVKLFLYRNGFGYIWEQQHVSNIKLFFKQLDIRLKDQFLGDWSAECHSNT
jgi:hypothetical protein